MRNMGRGFTLVEILIIIAVVAVLAAASVYFAGGKAAAEKKACLAQLDRVRDAIKLANTPPKDKALCQSAKEMAEKYNKQCGELIGTVPVPVCE